MTLAYATSPVMDKKRRTAGNILIYAAGLVLMGSACTKLVGVPAVVAQMSLLGLTDGRLTLVGLLEIFSAVLFIYPPVRSIGLLVVSSYLGGAICAHVQHGQYGAAFSPAMVLGLCWLGAYLRHPQVLWSFGSQPRQLEGELSR
jgi:hypothetical protein